MGDLQTDQGESLELQFVPLGEFERLRAASIDAVGCLHAGPRQEAYYNTVRSVL